MLLNLRTTTAMFGQSQVYSAMRTFYLVICVCFCACVCVCVIASASAVCTAGYECANAEEEGSQKRVRGKVVDSTTCATPSS